MNKTFPTTLPFFTMILMISFASVNAVLYTPSLPSIEKFFSISSDAAQMTISLFLVGYALGQLLYGPLANRFGRKPALYIGIGLQIFSSLLCVISSFAGGYLLLLLGRFLLALGSAVGLKMTFTLVNECYEPKIASQKISYLLLAFAITPGLGVALGGVLTEYWGWTSCFYACALYGVLLFFLVKRLQETAPLVDVDALKITHLFHEYRVQFHNLKLVTGGLMMGCATSFTYLFAADAPFVAINHFGMTSSQYGFANFIPPIGLVVGSLMSAKLISMHFHPNRLIFLGIIITGMGVLFMLIAIMVNLPVLTSLFMPMIIILFGLCFIIANVSTIAMNHVSDTAHGSAVLNFLNMGLATVVVLALSWLPTGNLLLPILFFILVLGLTILYKQLVNQICSQS